MKEKAKLWVVQGHNFIGSDDEFESPFRGIIYKMKQIMSVKHEKSSQFVPT